MAGVSCFTSRPANHRAVGLASKGALAFAVSRKTAMTRAGNDPVQQTPSRRGRNRSPRLADAADRDRGNQDGRVTAVCFFSPFLLATRSHPTSQIRPLFHRTRKPLVTVGKFSTL